MTDVRPPSIPDGAASRRLVEAADGIRLSLYRLPGGPTDGPALLWGHANGFAAGSYLPLLQELTERFRVYAFDARAHGGSDPSPHPLVDGLHVDRIADDAGRLAAAVRAEIGDAPFYYAAHSFSGVAALRYAGVFGPSPWTAITCFEPPLVPTPDVLEHGVAMQTTRGLMAQSARRRPRWASPEAMEVSLGKRYPYSGFRPDMLAAHTRALLHPTPDGDCILACAPESERAIYESVLNSSTFRGLPDIDVPVTLVAGDPASPDGPPSWAALVQAPASRRLARGRLVQLTGVGHMMPFENTERCRTIVNEMLD